MALDPINSAIFNIADIIGLNSKSTKFANVGFNIEEFKSNISKQYGIAKTSLFLVNIFHTLKPNWSGETKSFYHTSAMSTSTNNNQAARNLTFFCGATNLPGLNIDTATTRRYGIGPSQKIPVSVSYPDLNLIFYGDNSGFIHNFFRYWMNSIVMANFDGPVNSNEIANQNPFDRTSISVNLERDIRKKAPYEFEYKTNYTMTVEISLFDSDSHRFETRKFLDVYPTSVGDVNLSWGNTDEFMRIPVNLTYSRYFTSSEVYPAPRASQVNNLSLLQKLIKAGTAVQTLSTVKKPRSVADMINLTNNASIAGGGLRGLF
jgi:hypothetical protein